MDKQPDAYNTRVHIYKAFGPHANVVEIKENLQKMLYATPKISAYKGDSGGSASTIHGVDIHFNRPFYDKTKTASDRAGTVIHELAHYAVNAHDNFDRYTYRAKSRSRRQPGDLDGRK